MRNARKTPNCRNASPDVTEQIFVNPFSYNSSCHWLWSEKIITEKRFNCYSIYSMEENEHHHAAPPLPPGNRNSCEAKGQIVTGDWQQYAFPIFHKSGFNSPHYRTNAKPIIVLRLLDCGSLNGRSCPEFEANSVRMLYEIILRFCNLVWLEEGDFAIGRQQCLIIRQQLPPIPEVRKSISISWAQ